MADMLRQRGWFVIPSYDYSGEDGNKAPRMDGKASAFILPDLDVCRTGHRGWIEVKTKTEATLHRKTRTYEHGIGLYHWDQYKRVEIETGCSVWLAIVEQESQEILIRQLSELGRGRIYEGGKMDRRGMIFWPRSHFLVWPDMRRASAVPPGKQRAFA